MSLLMMNLLIGIISEKLAEVLENRVRNDYAELCDMIQDLELLMVWNRDKVCEPFHLVWAHYLQNHDEDEWQGRVQATTQPIVEQIDNLETKFNKGMHERGEKLQQVLDILQQK